MTTHSFVFPGWLLSLACLGGCLMMPPPQQGPGNTTPSPSEPGAAASPSEPGATTSSDGAGAASSTPVPTSIEVHSDCPQTLPLFIGEKPKFGSGTKTSIGSNTTTTFPRKSDGTAMIWIIDEQENGVASVSVTPQTKKVEIGRDCKAISAR